MQSLRKLSARFATDRRANVAIIAALALPAMVGFCGLATETAYWYFRDRDLQGAADVAAYNGAVALRGGASSTSIASGASSDAVTNGWRSATGTITVHTPPTSGTHQNAQSVEVILTETQTRYFTGMFTSTPVVITNRSVAAFQNGGNACLLALDKAKSGAMQFWGNTTSTFTACNVYSDSISTSGFMVGGSASATMPCAFSAGNFNVDAGLHETDCAAPIANAGQVADPYASLPTPSYNGCTNGNPSPMTPGKYCNGLTINGTVTMQPGVYIVRGGNLKINANANITGTGVTIFLTNGATVQMNGNATVNLSAPTSGDYSGVLLYGDRTQAYAVNKINGTADSQMTGAMYFASQEVDLQGNFSGANGCQQVVANTINYTGNSHFATDCTAYGMKKVPLSGLAKLVE